MSAFPESRTCFPKEKTSVVPWGEETGYALPRRVCARLTSPGVPGAETLTRRPFAMVHVDSCLSHTRLHLLPRSTQDGEEKPSEPCARSPKRLPTVSTPETQGESERTCPQLWRTLATISYSQKFSVGWKSQHPLNHAALRSPTPVPQARGDHATTSQASPNRHLTCGPRGTPIAPPPGSAQHSELENQRPRGISQGRSPQRSIPALHERRNSGTFPQETASVAGVRWLLVPEDTSPSGGPWGPRVSAQRHLALGGLLAQEYPGKRPLFTVLLCSEEGRGGSRYESPSL